MKNITTYFGHMSNMIDVTYMTKCLTCHMQEGLSMTSKDNLSFPFLVLTCTLPPLARQLHISALINGPRDSKV
jgi:hypothetical protein